LLDLSLAAFYVSLLTWGGIEDGYERSYNHCVEQQAQKQMLADARVYCGVITGRSDFRRKQRLQ